MPRMCGYCKKVPFDDVTNIWTCKNDQCGNYQIKAQVFKIRCSCVIDNWGKVVSACSVHNQWLIKTLQEALGTKLDTKL